MTIVRDKRNAGPASVPFERRAALAAVNALAIELAALPPRESVQQCLSDRLLELSGAVAAAFSDYDPEARVLSTYCISAAPGVMDTLNRAVGKRMVGQPYPVTEESLRMMLETPVGHPDSLSEITFGRVPPLLGATVQKLFGVDRFLALTYTVRGELYGTSILALRAGVPDPDPEMLEAIASVGAVSLCRRRAEYALYSLNTELEARIAQRTDDLERANQDLFNANILLAALNTDLEETVHLLNEATRAKSDFLASVSHELRTPLNSIIGFSGTMLGGLAGEVNPEQERQLRMISTSGKHLLGLINEILDITRIESGQIEDVLDNVDAIGIAGKVLGTVAPMADAKGLELRLDAPEVIPHIVSNEKHIEQALLNLLSNAIKFTDRGEVVLRVTARGGGVLFEVRDTGCGVAPEHLAGIFEEFYRAPQADGKIREGTGLGLPLSRRLVESLGGVIDCVSEPGKGSTFTAWLPSARG